MDRSPGHGVLTDDAGLVAAYVGDGARSGGGTTLRIDGDVLELDGWWPLAFRVADDVFGVRADDPPVATTVVAELVAALEARGLRRVADDPPLLHTVTYSEVVVGLVAWSLWARDPGAGDAALEARARSASALTHSSTDLPF